MSGACTFNRRDLPCSRPNRLLAFGGMLLLSALAALLLLERFEPAGAPLLAATGGPQLGAADWQQLGRGNVEVTADALILRRTATSGRFVLYRFFNRPTDARAFAVRARLSAEVATAAPGEWNGVRLFLAAPRQETGLPYRFRAPDLLQSFTSLPTHTLSATVVAPLRHQQIGLVVGLFATAGELRLAAIELAPLRETLAFKVARAGLTMLAASWMGLWLFAALAASGRTLAWRGAIATAFALIAAASGFAATRLSPEPAVFAEACAHLAGFAALASLTAPELLDDTRLTRLALLFLACAGFELAQGFVDTVGTDDLVDLVLDLAGAGLGAWIAQELASARMGH